MDVGGQPTLLDATPAPAWYSWICAS